MHGRAPETKWTVFAIVIGVSAAAVLVLGGVLIHGT